MRSIARAPRQLRIEELSEKAGTSIRNIQKYISIGLMRPPVGKTRNAYYLESHLHDLLEIRALMSKEGSLARVADLMAAKRRKAVEEEASEGLGQSDLDGAVLFRTMSVVEDMLLVVSRNLPMSQDVQQILFSDIRKAFDKARQNVAGGTPSGDRAMWPSGK